MGRGSSGIKTAGQKNMSKDLTAAIKLAEDQIRGNKTESAIAFDDAGNILFNTSDGKAQEVNLTPLMQNLAYGMTITHNHPNGYYFSNEDLSVMQTVALKQMRATTPDGRAFVLEKGSGKGNISGLRDAYRTAINDTKLEAVNKASRGDFSNAKEFNHLAALEHTKILNRWLKDNAPRYGYRFREE